MVGQYMYVTVTELGNVNQYKVLLYRKPAYCTDMLLCLRDCCSILLIGNHAVIASLVMKTKIVEPK